MAVPFSATCISISLLSEASDIGEYAVGVIEVRVRVRACWSRDKWVWPWLGVGLGV